MSPLMQAFFLVVLVFAPYLFCHVWFVMFVFAFRHIVGPSGGSAAELSMPAAESAVLPDANAKFSAL